MDQINILKNKVLELIYKSPYEVEASIDERIRVTGDYIDEASEITKIYLDNAQKNSLLQNLLDETILPYRKIQTLMDDPGIEEIMINSLESVFVKNRFSDNTELTKISFENHDELASLVEKLLEGTGRKVDWSSPLVDARLADGSRLNIVSQPIIKSGFCITIRKFPDDAYSIDDLVGKKTLSKKNSRLLREAIREKLNILVVGGTASGKTTLLSSLMGVLAEDSPETRVVVIEETSEIYIPKVLTNTISMETKPAVYGNEQEISIRDLVKNSLRMRPERIIIGELRGPEAFDFLQAANTGHPGSITTIHANSINDAIKRLESLVLLAGFSQLPLPTIHSWVMDAIDLVVFIEKMPDNRRRITNISKIKKRKLKSVFKL